MAVLRNREILQCLIQMQSGQGIAENHQAGCRRNQSCPVRSICPVPQSVKIREQDQQECRRHHRQYRISLICSGFGINLHQIKYKVVEQTEKWYPNGDGELFIRLSFPTAQDGELKDISSQMSDSGAIYSVLRSHHCIVIPNLNMGRYMEIRTKVTMAPIMRIINGSKVLFSCLIL